MAGQRCVDRLSLPSPSKGQAAPPEVCKRCGMEIRPGDSGQSDRERSGYILIYPTEDQRSDGDVQSNIGVLQSVTNVIDLKEYDRAKEALANLTRLSVY